MSAYARRYNPLFDNPHSRGRGNGSSVRVVRTTSGGPRRGTAEYSEAESRARWDFAVSDFLEGLCFDLFGDQWVGL
jgi:hypothetical protein